MALSEYQTRFLRPLVPGGGRGRSLAARSVRTCPPPPAQPQATGKEALPEDARPALCPAGAVTTGSSAVASPPQLSMGEGFVRPFRGVSHSQGPVLLGCLPHGGLSRKGWHSQRAGIPSAPPHEVGFSCPHPGTHVLHGGDPCVLARALVMQGAVLSPGGRAGRRTRECQRAACCAHTEGTSVLLRESSRRNPVCLEFQAPVGLPWP